MPYYTYTLEEPQDSFLFESFTDLWRFSFLIFESSRDQYFFYLQVAILVAFSELDRLRTERDDEASARRALEQRFATAAMAIPRRVGF